MEIIDALITLEVYFYGGSPMRVHMGVEKQVFAVPTKTLFAAAPKSPQAGSSSNSSRVSKLPDADLAAELAKLQRGTATSSMSGQAGSSSSGHGSGANPSSSSSNSKSPSVDDLLYEDVPFMLRRGVYLDMSDCLKGGSMKLAVLDPWGREVLVDTNTVYNGELEDLPHKQVSHGVPGVLGWVGVSHL